MTSEKNEINLAQKKKYFIWPFLLQNHAELQVIWDNFLGPITMLSLNEKLYYSEQQVIKLQINI